MKIPPVDKSRVGQLMAGSAKRYKVIVVKATIRTFGQRLNVVRREIVASYDAAIKAHPTKIIIALPYVD